jgi:hypothetical protein
MMDKTRLQLVGGGGHCHSVIESIERTGIFDIVGISEVPVVKVKTYSGIQLIFQMMNYLC